jgi:hypothetical protein
MANTKEYSRQWYAENRDKAIQYQREYRLKTKEKQSQYNKQAYEKRKVRYANDVNFRLAANLRNRLNKAIKNNYKVGSAVKDLGCSIEDFKKYIESKFQTGMTWGNWSRDGWHIDHIVPLYKLDLTNLEQFKIACNYTNMQPLWVEDHKLKTAEDIL